MSVHYKFKSALEYDTVTFDGLHISVRDLKNAIVQQKRIGKNTDFDLQVTNAQTKEIYDNDEALIPKNTSLLIARIPSQQTKPKTWEGYGGNSSPITKVDDGGPAAKAMDLSSIDASEDDKIKAMMTQSTQDYDPSNYVKIRGANQTGSVPPNYRCFKCHQGGHWIKDCPLSLGPEPLEIKKSTGIPRSFMVPVEGPQVPGAMMTPNGSFAVPVLDHQAYNEKPQSAPPPEEKRTEIPDDLVCSLCSDLLTDAVMIPCCGDSYCDECIRSVLLDSEDHECPACHERDISPATLIPNRYLRNSVTSFKSTTGYVKRLTYKPAPPPPPPPPVAERPNVEAKNEPLPVTETEQKVKEATPQPEVTSNGSEKTVIREADSTDAHKPNVPKADFPEDGGRPSRLPPVISEGPPGVSPKHEQSPKAQPITNVANVPRAVRPHKMTTNERSPRRPHHISRSPSYQESMSRAEDRPGTPTVDEPGLGGMNAITSVGPTTIYPTAPPMYSSGLPSNILGGMMGIPPPNMQGPPPPIPNVYGPLTTQAIPPAYPPPTQGGPLPNFRLPPPGAPPFIPGGAYNQPPVRPVFDCTRPPIAGTTPFPPMYPTGPRNSRGRDYPREVPRRARTPPRIIDDPLEAFNRMLREKDERERRAKQRKARSYSRSSSRSFSRSPRRMRSRTPRRRTRSRSRSFSISRSRSRSFSPSSRASPPRQYSPKRSPLRRAHSRYRSPVRSPPRYRYKEAPIIERDRGRGDREMERDRDRDKDFRDRERGNRGFSRERDRERERDFRDRDGRDRDYQYFDNFERDRGGRGGRANWNQSASRKDYADPPEPYYHPQEMSSQSMPPFGSSNRYQQREVFPPHHPPPPVQHQHQHPPPLLHSHPAPTAQHLPPIRRYDDVAPPGTEQPPIPGLENPPKFEDRFSSYDRNPPPAAAATITDKFSPSRTVVREKEIDKRDDRRDGRVDEFPDRKHERYSRSPERTRHSPPRRHPSKSPEKHKRRRFDDSLDRDKRDSDKEKHDRKRDASDEERARKNKEKKKKKDKKERKEEERKKRKEKKEKREQDKLNKKLAEEKERSEKKLKAAKVETEMVETKRTVMVHKETNKDRASEEIKEVKEKPKEEIVSDVIEKNEKKQTETKEDNNSSEEIVKGDDEKVTEEVIEEEVKEVEEIPKSVEEQSDLYGDILSEGIDNNVIENYGKLTDFHEEPALKPIEPEVTEQPAPPETENVPPTDEQQELETKDNGDDDSERDILELHTNEAELKTDLEIKSEVLAPLPERSKWEFEEESGLALNSSSKSDMKFDKQAGGNGKVTNEVLKRAENAIFAKAINAIRPIEIKRISLDRAKLYSNPGGERDKKPEDLRDEARNIHITISGSGSYDEEVIPVDADPSQTSSKPRLSVKERLGCKVDDLDRIVKIEKPYDRNRSRSLSPLSRRAELMSRNLGQGERRIEVDDQKHSSSRSSRHPEKGHDHHHHHSRQYRAERDVRRSDHDKDSRRTTDHNHKRDVSHIKDNKDSRKERDTRKDDRRVSHSRPRGRSSRDRDRDRDDKRRRKSKSRSNSHDKDKRRKKEKREKKKEKVKKHKKEEDVVESSASTKTTKTDDADKNQKPKSATDKRKPTLDEANFEPDYDLETESEKEDGANKGEKGKKRTLAPPAGAEDEISKKKSKLEERKQESSSSDSSDSSTEDEKKRKKHKKHKKKSRKDSSSSSDSESNTDSSDEEKDKKRKKHKRKQKKRKKSKHK